MTLRTVKKPTSTTKEKIIPIFLALFIFVPFITGLYTNNHLLLISLPVGLLLIYIFNLSTKGKFIEKNWIQQSTLEFTNNELIYKSETKRESFSLEKMRNFHLNLVSYKNESDELGQFRDLSLRSGVRNWLEFEMDNKSYHYGFFLEDRDKKNELVSIINNSLSRTIINGKITVLIRKSNGYTTCDLRKLKELKIPNC